MSYGRATRDEETEPWQGLREGIVIPASPLALTSERKLDERRQRALWRYYASAGAGGIAVGVHTTQFAIRDPKIGLFRPLLELGRDEMDRLDGPHPSPLLPSTGSGRGEGARSIFRIGGICGRTEQAVSEAALIRELGYHAGMLSLAAMKDADDDALIGHCRAVADVIPLIGFYLQPAVGGRVLPYAFWRRFAEIENVVAVKIAPFNRYWTIDVIRALAESGRDDIAIYTGNDDNIVMDLLTPYRIDVSGFCPDEICQAQRNRNPETPLRSDVSGLCPDQACQAQRNRNPETPGGRQVERRIVGGLLGHWSVWTKKAVELLGECHEIVRRGGDVPMEMLRRSIEVTDCNAAFFDAANGFAGCIAGVHEVLRRQGLLEGVWCLDPNERLSPGQSEEIDRVYRAYPHLNDDAFVAGHLDEWLD